MRALLLATMSHDLKGPLNAILGFAALLERGASSPRVNARACRSSVNAGASFFI